MKTTHAFAAAALIISLAAPAAALAADFDFSFLNGNPLAYTAAAFSSFLKLPYCYMSVSKQSSSFSSSRGSFITQSDKIVYPGDVLKFKWLAIGMKSPILYYGGKPTPYETIERSGTRTLTVGQDIIPQNNVSTPLIVTLQIGPTVDKAMNDPSCRIEIKSLAAPTSTSSSGAMQTSSGQDNGTAGTGTSGSSDTGINKIIKDKILNIVGGGGSGSGASGSGAGYSGGNSIQSTGGFFYLPVGNTGTGEYVNPFGTSGVDDSASKELLRGQTR